MSPLTASLMAIGVGSAAGLRPYFTAFMLAAFGMAVPAYGPEFLQSTAGSIPETIANPWVLGISGALAFADLVIDKILGINLPMEAINQFLRPILGALLGAQLGAEAGPTMAVVTALLGGGAAAPVSIGKGAVTAGMTAILPEPISQVLRSLGEDAAALVLVVAAVLAPLLAALLGIVLVVAAVFLFLMIQRALRSLSKTHTARASSPLR
ncbi:DUF4126 domain-containing protein [Dermabacteraceae bacterium P13115]